MQALAGFDWDLHGKQIVLFAAVLGAVAVIVKYVSKAIRWGVRGFATASTMAHRAMEVIEFVEHELKPNNGASIKDAIDRIDERVASLETRAQAAVRTDELLAKVTPTLPKGPQ